MRGGASICSGDRVQLYPLSLIINANKPFYVNGHRELACHTCIFTICLLFYFCVNFFFFCALLSICSTRVALAVFLRLGKILAFSQLRLCAPSSTCFVYTSRVFFKFLFTIYREAFTHCTSVYTTGCLFRCATG